MIKPKGYAMTFKVIALDVRQGPTWAKGRNVKARIHVYPQGDNTWRALTERHNHPYEAYKAEPGMIESALVALGLDPATAKVRWSQKAGCSCGCSPAFIVHGPDSYKAYGKTCSITIELA